MTRITLETCYGTYTIEVPDDDLTTSDIVGSLVEPVLKAAGYAEQAVHDALGYENTEDE